MKNGQWFQKILQCLIAVTGSYILYRGGGILAETGWLKQFFQSEKTVKTMQDAAVELYFPGYIQNLQNTSEDILLHSWLKELVPVLEEWYEQIRKQQEYAGEMTEEQEPEAEASEVETEGLESRMKEPERGTEEPEKGTKEPENGMEKPERGTEEPERETEGLESRMKEPERGTEEPEKGTEEPESGEEPERGTEEPEKGTEGPERGTEGPESGMETSENGMDGLENEALENGTEDFGNREEAETEYQETEYQETEYQDTEYQETETEIREALSLSAEQLEQLQDFDYLLNHYFVVDTDTVTDKMQLDAAAFLEKDLSIEKNPSVPQILIYHTHSQEAFLDSVEGDTGTTIIGIGDYLAELLEEKYGYQVIHDTGVYDLVDGVLDRSAAYDYARASVEQILEENPTIEVIIDLHRDGVEGVHFVTEEMGKSTAKIMFFNGLSKDNTGQPLDYLYNPYIEENLAFSFQLQLAAQQYYPGFTRNIYLKGQRFNLHLRPRSLLVEAGTQLNTVEEEKNAMEPLADILNEVLSRSGRETSH